MPSSRTRALLASLSGLVAVVVVASPASAQVPLSDYAARRAALAERIDSGVVVAFGAVEPVNYWPSFFQLPAFYYLTGFGESDAVLVMVKRNGAVTATMFVPSPDPLSERWIGARTHVAEMQARSESRAATSRELRHGVRFARRRPGSRSTSCPTSQTADYAAEDSLTRGARFLSQVRQAIRGW